MKNRVQHQAACAEEAPAQQLSRLMSRIYAAGLTTTSGGNLSVLDEQGSIWITPGGIDKSNLTPEDIISIDTEGNISGKHSPSIETAFHKGLYEARKDVKAVVHAHAPASSAFCMIREAPDVKCMPQVYLECGEAAMTGYAAPGSDLLGEKLKDQAHKGHHVLLLDNHGAAAVGRDLLHAFQRFEALNVCSSTLIEASALGPVKQAEEDAHRLLAAQLSYPAGEVLPSDDQYDKRLQLSGMTRRAYARGLMTSSLGSLSIRVSDDAFLITPFGGDRYRLSPEDTVLVQGQCIEPGKQPDLWTALHRGIYETHQGVSSVMTSLAPSVAAFTVTDAEYSARTLTEGYVLLRDIKQIDFIRALSDPLSCAAELSESSPVLLISHGGMVAAGNSLLQVLDRIEVAEASMRSALWGIRIGNPHILNDRDIEEMKAFFKLS